MRKHVLALALALATAGTAAGIANADPPPTQVAGQTATTSQQSVAASGATQIAPSNTNVSVRVLSPGDDGDVTQTNSAASSASSGNQASTTQSADQSGGGVQTAKQDAGTEQLALALSLAKQEQPTNANVPVRVGSPGSNGDVTQSNDASSSATAGNAATTGQSSEQGSGPSCGCDGSGGVQTAQQSADTDQTAGALSAAEQVHPTNTNVSVRVLSEGDDGDVSQSNSAASSAAAGNEAGTTQDASQAQGAGGVQTAQQSADTEQAAGALSAAKQVHPKNENVSVRVLSPGSNGDVTQSNSAQSSAQSGNSAGTTQHATQGQDGGCGCGGTAVQQSKQSADTEQHSGALSAAAQLAPANESSPVRVASHGSDGDVTQSNDASSSARSGNRAWTGQDATQSGGGVQVAGQDASTHQGSLAGSAAIQLGASNEASPVRVWSPGGGGSVTQSNSASSSAESGNEAGTRQDAEQTGSGRGCGCDGGVGVQALGQRSDTEQTSVGLSAALQAFAPRKGECGCGGSSGNVASPVRVGSYGSDGDVTQSNDASSSARSGNRATTDQTGGQSLGGGGLTVQALGQDAATSQASLAASLAFQLGASNEALPVRVWSPGGGGSVDQSNDAASSAASGNDAATRQHGDQSASGGCGCSTPIQALGQRAGTWQPSAAFSGALQLFPANDASPASVWSPSRGSGTTSQSSSSSSRGDSGNRGETAQDASQGS